MEKFSIYKDNLPSIFDTLAEMFVKGIDMIILYSGGGCFVIQPAWGSFIHIIFIIHFRTIFDLIQEGIHMKISY